MPTPDTYLLDSPVLVAEDSPVQRHHAVALLRQLGAGVILEASNGYEALALLERHPDVGLLLSDLDMPGMDGVTLIGELAARGYTPHIVVISAQEAPVLHAVSLMVGTYGLPLVGTLEKPLTYGALGSLLQGPAKKRPQIAIAPVLPELDEIRDGVRTGAFTCFFQPQLTLQGALFPAAEALVRWRHPTRGLLGPGAFLPSVEGDVPLMQELTLAVLDTVAEQWHGWKRRGMLIHVSVNLSARSLSQAGFADSLMAAAEGHDLDPKHIAFELTESASVSHLGHSLANLTRLRIRGFKLAIDDFGTGYATFEQLERIPFTELKLDRSIIMHLPQSDRHCIMARRMFQMARDLKLQTVAEGVETLEQWQTLRELGCERAQGYLMGRPMPGEEIPEWARQDRQWLRDAG